MKKNEKLLFCCAIEYVCLPSSDEHVITGVSAVTGDIYDFLSYVQLIFSDVVNWCYLILLTIQPHAFLF